MSKNIYEINKNDNNIDIYSQVSKCLNSFDFTDKKLTSVSIFIIYNSSEINFNNNLSNNVSYLKNPEDHFNDSQDIKISVFKACLSCIERDFIIPNKDNSIKLLVAFNIAVEKVYERFFIKKESSNSLNIEPTEPKYSLSQIILNKNTLEEIEKVLVLIKNIKTIYNDWGFDKVDPVAKCIINFYGHPGTGKTMSAHIVAKELGMKILALNYSDIESKYVGDAPKNLVQAFNIASQENSILFFDEADSFLGKRITNVSSSSDQAVNSLRSQMLILLESFNGIVIFATNLYENYDSAFESRILRNIKFEMPDRDIRKDIIKKMIPINAPIDAKLLEDDEFLLELSDMIDGTAPREIKNIILDLLVSSLQMGCHIDKELLLKIFTEYKEKYNTSISKNNSSNYRIKTKIKRNLRRGTYSVKRNTLFARR